jgi:hypothetical protein
MGTLSSQAAPNPHKKADPKITSFNRSGKLLEALQELALIQRFRNI